MQINLFNEFISFICIVPFTMDIVTKQLYINKTKHFLNHFKPLYNINRGLAMFKSML